MLQITDDTFGTYQELSKNHLHDTFCTSFSCLSTTFNNAPGRNVTHFCFTHTHTHAPTSQCPSSLGSSEVCVGRWNWYRLFVDAPCSPERPSGRRCYNTRLQRYCVVNIEPIFTQRNEGLRTFNRVELNPKGRRE